MTDRQLNHQEFSIDSESTLLNDLLLFRSQVENDFTQRHDLYSSALMQLAGKMHLVHPGTVFFTERSARPVQWMLEGYFQKTDPNFLQGIDIHHISMDVNYPQDANAEKEARAHFISLNTHRPIVIVDEYDDAVREKRLIDYASVAMTRIFDMPHTLIHGFIYLDGVRLAPQFYRTSDWIKTGLFFLIYKNIVILPDNKYTH